MLMITDIVLISILLIDLYLLGASRLGASIKAMALQGVILGVLPLLIYGSEFSVHTFVMFLGSLLTKGIIIPALLFRAIREVNIRREIEPYVGHTASLLLGMGMLVISFWIAHHLSSQMSVSSNLFIPVALATVMIGLFLLVSRKKAVTQVLGYLVLENGIYVFGLVLAPKMPFLVEMGVLLDVFVGVFIMGITMNHIQDVFDDLDVDNLTILKD